MQTSKALTVQTLIEHLKTLPPDQTVPLGLDAGSYRGYYNHVHISPGQSEAGELGTYLTNKLNTPMTGWKGGDYTFDANCYVFYAEPGDLGELIQLTTDGELIATAYPFIW